MYFTPYNLDHWILFRHVSSISETNRETGAITNWSRSEVHKQHQNNLVNKHHQ